MSGNVEVNPEQVYRNFTRPIWTVVVESSSSRTMPKYLSNISEICRTSYPALFQVCNLNCC